MLSVDKDEENLDPSDIVGNIKWYSDFGKQPVSLKVKSLT